MNRRAVRALLEWHDEVESKAAELIEGGWEPLEAFELAKKAVSKRRQNTRQNDGIPGPCDG